MFIDGSSKINESKGFSLWPVLLNICNLPNKVSGSFQNIILCGVYWGSTKPDFHSFLKPITRLLECLIQTGIDIDGVMYSFKLNFLIADMVAKAPLLQMSQFNG